MAQIKAGLNIRLFESTIANTSVTLCLIFQTLFDIKFKNSFGLFLKSINHIRNLKILTLLSFLFGFCCDVVSR